MAWKSLPQWWLCDQSDTNFDVLSSDVFLEMNHRKENQHNYWLLHSVALADAFRGDMGNKL